MRKEITLITFSVSTILMQLYVLRIAPALFMVSEQNGKWGLKQRRVYELDEDGNRIRDADGKFVFNAVPTTDWGSPETLEYWRQTWAELCNGKFAEKGLDVRIDHRSYERQGVELSLIHTDAADE